MKLIHTADWHLGRIFYGRHLTEDQAYVLDRFVDLVGTAEPDAVLIAGDVYDRAVPPIEAVRLLDDVLARIVTGLGIPVVLIAGNHDSPERIAFASELLGEKGLHVAGPVGRNAAPVILEDGSGPVALCPVPYAEPALVRESLKDDAVRDHGTALAALLERMRARVPPGCRSVAVCHAYVTGGESSDSERPLSLGGSGQVDASLFEGFHYVALGHLHRAQAVARPHIRYAGSLLKYSFSEAQHSKSVDLVELDGRGSATVESIPIEPLRDVRCIQGRLDELLESPDAGVDVSDASGVDDFIMVTLEDRSALLNVMGKLRKVYPNVLHVERLKTDVDAADGAAARDIMRRTEKEMMEAFFKDATGDAMSSDEREEFIKVLESLHRREREEPS